MSINKLPLKTMLSDYIKLIHGVADDSIFINLLIYTMGSMYKKTKNFDINMPLDKNHTKYIEYVDKINQKYDDALQYIELEFGKIIISYNFIYIIIIFDDIVINKIIKCFNILCRFNVKFRPNFHIYGISRKNIRIRKCKNIKDCYIEAWKQKDVNYIIRNNVIQLYNVNCITLYLNHKNLKMELYNKYTGISNELDIKLKSIPNIVINENKMEFQVEDKMFKICEYTTSNTLVCSYLIMYKIKKVPKPLVKIIISIVTNSIHIELY